MLFVTEEKIAKWAEKGNAEKLIKAAASKKPNIKLAAVKALGNVDDDQVFNLLITCLRDRSPEVKLAAMDSLKKLKAKKAVEHVKSLVNDTNPQVVDKAREVLKQLNNI